MKSVSFKWMDYCTSFDNMIDYVKEIKLQAWSNNKVLSPPQISCIEILHKLNSATKWSLSINAHIGAGDIPVILWSQSSQYV